MVGWQGGLFGVHGVAAQRCPELFQIEHLLGRSPHGDGARDKTEHLVSNRSNDIHVVLHDEHWQGERSMNGQQHVLDAGPLAGAGSSGAAA